jgi:hypothetical protein
MSPASAISIVLGWNSSENSGSCRMPSQAVRMASCPWASSALGGIITPSLG